MKLDDDIHNYYEKLVIDKIENMGIANSTPNPNYLADLCCLVLNQLPPRYIRYEVDMAFYLAPAERLQMEMNVTNAIETSIKFLKEQEKLNN
ncbi:late competence development ComFB family protein [Catenovulum sp. 2E275]|uniref:late competence development ComFB family protein n=1 Tax=Catenovulum sp. 2E275 TaxID=2980497 RepID=UPI0021D3E2F7|nr:late competence development ComFB family protein [Catenovulum sp. 2E275]MCU4674283.1 late competence development ComFB family protein [Catenovulum sp. 2E275]